MSEPTLSEPTVSEPTVPPSRLNVALAQWASAKDPAVNRARLPLVAEEAVGADLVVLPEASARDFGAPGEPLGEFAEPLDGPFVAALTDVARTHGGTWVAGMFETSEDAARPYNTLVVVDGDGLRASYRKIHLYDSFGFKESDVLLAGPRVPQVVDVAGFPVGLMTCYDLRFPELARELTRRGAELLLVPAAWVAGPRKALHWRTLLAARAIENVAYAAGAGQPGPRYTGHSVLVDPRGVELAVAEESETVVSGLVDRAAVAAARGENPSLDNRRDASPWEGSEDRADH